MISSESSSIIEQVQNSLQPQWQELHQAQLECDSQILEDHFIIGLIDGDGCFNLNFLANRKISFGFHITGDLSQKDLFIKIQNKFQCGSIRIKDSGTLRYQVDSFQDICDKIVPFVDQYGLFTIKQ